MTFTRIVGTPFTKSRLFFYTVSFVLTHFFHLCFKSHNQSSAMSADIKEAKTTNLKDSVKREDVSNPSLWQHTSVCTNVTLQQWGGGYCSPSSPLESRFSTLQLPSVLPPWRMHYKDAVLQMTWNRESEEIRRSNKELHATGIQRLMQGWKKCVDNKDLAEK